ncbi:hypothetical protein FIU89_17265 [Roseovarius sp. THAF27]|nr:hypothetical protein FIU89_17265 [Roseovarius sp. THAF27]
MIGSKFSLNKKAGAQGTRPECDLPVSGGLSLAGRFAFARPEETRKGS